MILQNNKTFFINKYGLKMKIGNIWTLFYWLFMEKDTWAYRLSFFLENAI